MQLFNLWMLAQELGNCQSILVRTVHTNTQRFKRAPQHPAGMRIELRSNRPTQCLYLLDDGLRTKNSTGDQIGMATNIFGQRVERDIGTMFKRLLENRAEQGVIANDDRTGSFLLRCYLIGNAPDGCDIDQTVGRIGGRFNQDDRDSPLVCGFIGSLFNRSFMHTIGKGHSRNIEIMESLREQCFCATVKRLRMQDYVSRARKSKQGCRNCRHAGREQRATLGPFVNGKTILHDLAVGMIEA
ncbi:hypothetical protein FQZ97_821020 [compost metagenome]